MRVRRKQFTVRGLIVAVAAVGVALGSSVMWLRWHRSPYVTVRVHNNTSNPLSDVGIRFRYGERKVSMIKAGGEVSWEISCSGASDVTLEYRNSLGVRIIKTDNTYIEHNYRGSLDLHIGDSGVKVVDRTSFSLL
jgi:hypothetical protein